MSKRSKIGNIVAIPLPNGKVGYGKLYNDASIGIYDFISEKIRPVEEVVTYPISFFTGVFDTSINNGNWPIIGNEPFVTEESSWPPPQYIQDIIDPTKYRIYYKGEMTPASKDEIQGLERQGMKKPEHLIDAICKRIKGEEC